MPSRYFLALLLLLIAKAAAMLLVILYAGISFGPDEAQYWTWSRHLDWGYYSKPPGIAWEIWGGTHLFGNTEAGVRSMPLLIGTAIPILVYFLAKSCRLAPSICFWAAVAMALSPIGVFASFLAITDGGMVLFWTAACIYTVSKIEKKQLPSYPLLGLLILGGALFKWPTYWFWLFVLGSWIFYPWMISWRILLGMAISLIALLPSLYWNGTHEWSTFRHVFATMSGGQGTNKIGTVFAGNILEFIGAQAALVSPILFILLIFSFWRLCRKSSTIPRGVFFCGAVALNVLAADSTVALFMKMQGNWAIFAYPTAFVFLCWYACELATGCKQALKVGILLSVVMCVMTLSIPFFQSHSILSGIPIPYRISPFRHNVGWEQLRIELHRVGYDPRRDFLFSDKYQMASILSFYGEGQKRAYFFNLQGIRKNQFSYWPTMNQEQKGQRGFFISVENIPQLHNLALVEEHEKRLMPYFEHVRFLGIKPLFWSYGKVVKGALIFECQNYNGKVPKDPALY